MIGKSASGLMPGWRVYQLSEWVSMQSRAPGKPNLGAIQTEAVIQAAFLS